MSRFQDEALNRAMDAMVEVSLDNRTWPEIVAARLELTKLINTLAEELNSPPANPLYWVAAEAQQVLEGDNLGPRIKAALAEVRDD